MLEENPDEPGGKHPDDQQTRIPQRLGLAPQDLDGQLPEPLAVDDEDRAERRDVQRDLNEHAGRVDAGHVPDDREVAVARDRQKLGESLHEPEENALPECHATFPATSAASPMTIAPLSSVLTRSTLPSNSHVAATSTAICARSAIRKYAAP